MKPISRFASDQIPTLPIVEGGSDGLGRTMTKLEVPLLGDSIMSTRKHSVWEMVVWGGQDLGERVILRRILGWLG